MIRQTGELTEALLEHARLAGAAIEWQEIDLSGQAHTIAAILRRTAPGRRVEFIIGTNLRAEGDPAMLRMLLSNLLGNAWKYTETVPRARIELAALPATDGTRGFMVRDNRAGLAPNRGHGLLRAFHRLHATRDFFGPDPGLAMVQRIIQRHGGRVWAEIDLRQGATFYFTLPQPGQGSAAKPSGGDKPDSLTG